MITFLKRLNQKHANVAMSNVNEFIKGVIHKVTYYKDGTKTLKYVLSRDEIKNKDNKDYIKEIIQQSHLDTKEQMI